MSLQRWQVWSSDAVLSVGILAGCLSGISCQPAVNPPVANPNAFSGRIPPPPDWGRVERGRAAVTVAVAFESLIERDERGSYWWGNFSGSDRIFASESLPDVARAAIELTPPEGCADPDQHLYLMVWMLMSTYTDTLGVEFDDSMRSEDDVYYKTAVWKWFKATLDQGIEKNRGNPEFVAWLKHCRQQLQLEIPKIQAALDEVCEILRKNRAKFAHLPEMVAEIDLRLNELAARKRELELPGK